MTQNLSDFTSKIQSLTRSVDQKFSELFSRFQPENPVITEVERDLQTKQVIQGQMTYQEVDALAKVLGENHDQAYEAYERTDDM